MTHTEKPFILVDGSSYLYRAFHALPPLVSSKGEPTGAVYGVVSMIKRLLKDYDPDYMAVVFDAKGKTFRDDLYPAYKATRPPMPSELRNQIQILHEIIKAMGLPLLVIDGVEADDVIGTLAKQAISHGLKTLISTGDKDMAQLVNEDVTLINTMTDTILDPKTVVEKFGVPPERIVDYLTLIGDKVDNIPGVDKVGPKTAVKWLEQYKSLDSVLQHADEIKGKVGENLRQKSAALPLSKELVTIKCDVDLTVTPESLKPQKPKTDKLIELYKRLEFKSWLSELLNHTNENKQNKNYQTILDKKEFDAWVNQLKQAEVFAFDTETDSLNYIQANLVGVSFAINANKAAYVPLQHDYENAPAQIDLEYALTRLKQLLEGSNYKKIGHNIKYDKNVLANYNINLQGIAFDTMLESYILNSSASRHDMDTLALKYLGVNTIHYEDVAGKGSKQVTFNKVEIPKAGDYAAEDADITLQLHQKLWPQVVNEKGLKYVYKAIEIPLIEVLAAIEQHGVLVDEKLLAAHSKELAKRLTQLEEKAYKLAGTVFNLNSTKQLQDIFYNKLKLPVLKKTPKGQPSTAENILQELALDFPLPKLILEYRGLTKLKSTYTDTLPKQIKEKTKRVHTSYNQAVAATGRLSSTDPNLQNIPVKTQEGRRIRKAFIAPKGYQILAADYSQIELRIMAHLSGDQGLREAFANKLDIHKATAAEVFNIDIDCVSSEQRRSAKAINFGLIYGMSAYGLSRQLGIETAIAKKYMDLYFQRYPGVLQYMESTRKLAHKQEYVETIFGRRLYLPEINSRNFMRQKAAERAAINAPMQGTAADIIKLAMIHVYSALKESQLDAAMIMQVHDELVFEVAKKDVEALKKLVTDKMPTAVKLAVPLVVDIGVGDNWDEAH